MEKSMKREILTLKYLIAIEKFEKKKDSSREKEKKCTL